MSVNVITRVLPATDTLPKRISVRSESGHAAVYTADINYPGLEDFEHAVRQLVTGWYPTVTAS